MKRIDHQGVLILLLFLINCPLWAQEIRARAEAFPRSCLIGDPIRYKVTVFASETTNVKFPTSSRFGAFEVLHRYPTQKQPSELPGIMAFSAEWDIAAYQLGKLTIPPMSITCETEGRQTLVRTNPVDIEVIPLAPPDAKEPRPAKAPMPYPLSPLSIALLLLGFFVTLAVVWLIGKAVWWGIQTAWSSWQKATSKPPLPPHLLALQTIERAEQLYRQGEIERSFILLSFGLRRYLRDRFQVPALELPTWHLLSMLQNQLTREQQRILHHTLILSDLIKFARYNPKETEAVSLFSSAKHLVQTTQIPEPEQNQVSA
ncbi:MAG: BatD family protein [Armatimonadota bacterium]